MSWKTPATTTFAAAVLVCTAGCASRTESQHREPVRSIPVVFLEPATPSASEPVTAVMQAVPEEVAAGGSFELLVRVAIAGAHHVYARVPEDSPFSAARLELNLPPGLEALDDWSRSEPVQRRPGQLVYTESAWFRRRFRVVSKPPDGVLTIKGALHYQACTEELCWPPGVLPLSASLRTASPKNTTP